MKKETQEKALRSYAKYAHVRDGMELTDFAIAQALGIPPSSLCDWHKGRSTPKADKLVKICDLLGVQIGWLLE